MRRFSISWQMASLLPSIASRLFDGRSSFFNPTTQHVYTGMVVEELCFIPFCFKHSRFELKPAW